MQTRIIGTAIALAMVYFIVQKPQPTNHCLPTSMALSERLPFLVAGLVLTYAGGGRHYVPTMSKQQASGEFNAA